MTTKTTCTSVQAIAPRAAPDKGIAASAGKPVSRLRVSRVTAGGYTVYGSPVRPAYRTVEQIAAAIARLD